MNKTFPRCVAECKPLAGLLCDGLRALSRASRSRVCAADAHRITGSVDLDSALKGAFPNAARWDYGVGYSADSRLADAVHWIEVHPSSHGEVKVILNKFQWLRKWLQANCDSLLDLSQSYVWVSSGSTTLSPASPDRRRLAAQGIMVAGARYTIR